MSHRFTYLHAFLSAAIVAVATAGCATEPPLPPSTSTGADIFLKTDTRVIEEVVPRGATLAGLLELHALDAAWPMSSWRRSGLFSIPDESA